MVPCLSCMANSCSYTYVLSTKQAYSVLLRLKLTAQHSTAQHSTAQHSTALHFCIRDKGGEGAYKYCGEPGEKSSSVV